jgi:hypothetical protein
VALWSRRRVGFDRQFERYLRALKPPRLWWRLRGVCDEHPKKMTKAQIANPRSDVPSEVRSQRRQHLTLEISPFNHNNHRWTIQRLVICNRLARCGC